jgi:hypothetical protein
MRPSYTSVLRGYNATLLNELLEARERCRAGGKWLGQCFRFRRCCISFDFDYFRLWSRQWWLLFFEYALLLGLHNRSCGSRPQHRGRRCVRALHGR